MFFFVFSTIVCLFIVFLFFLNEQVRNVASQVPAGESEHGNVDGLLGISDGRKYFLAKVFPVNG